MYKIRIGFTLIELLVALGLIAVLTAAVIAMIGQGPSQYARDGRRSADLQSIASALELYRNDNGTYPPCSGAGANCWPSGIVGAPVFTGYMTTIPDDQTSGWHYRYAPEDSGGGACAGTVADPCVVYVLCSGLEKITANLNTSCGGSAASASCGSSNCEQVINSP